MTTREVVETIAGLLTADDGLPQSLKATSAEPWLTDPDELREQIRQVQAPLDVVEKSFALRKTTVLVYCRRYTNQLEERFRGRGMRFEVVVEVIATQDRLEALRPVAMEYADAVVDLVERKSGCLGRNLVLRDRVEVQFDAAKRGGLNLTETAKITCAVEWKEG